jgi:F0F1-type ATP synthase epsilon subunit
MAHLPPIKVRIRDTQNIIFEGDCDRVSSYNEIGRFDVYPMHANFISILHQEIALYNKKAKVKELKIEQAVMKVKQDVLHIFLGIEAFMLDDPMAKIPVKSEKK